MDSLRSALQPITHNLPTPIQDLGISLLGPSCYRSLMLDIDVEAVECLKLAVSKGLGIAIVGAASIVKLPQIIKLARSQSATGVSFLSYLLETSALLITLAYNVRNAFPFSTYGESALILAQDIVICLLVLNYQRRPGGAAVLVAGLAVGASGLLVADADTLGYLQAGAGVLGVASKLPQIVAIWQQGSTGQLSAFAVFNYLLGSLSRIFTTLQEVDDKLILYGFVAGFILNAVLALQMVYYWNAPSGKAMSKRKEAPSATTTATSMSGKSPTTRRRG
ncbi:hypothetical protein L249_7788 [Ophiocordyceps polyrhachis-furcata BCC 54312]|uniref:Mannose-P-dolichol utilization defect 1 protein homolog n=1 Tax=Ophiocordyceps polyrhachis-furcata BCC 54312 TaxID=1330021 RepID=A0A367L0P3_9HYPO|nr:hypothetical protein L249_7788 [Ophiocordyceps polyrhachis-furcata BCC 54312]